MKTGPAGWVAGAAALLHTAHCTLHTAHCTLHTAHYTLHTTHCTLHTTHCTLDSTPYSSLTTSTCCSHLLPPPRLTSPATPLYQCYTPYTHRPRYLKSVEELKADRGREEVQQVA